MNQRSRCVPRRRVDDDSGRLVHDEEVLVLEGDPQREVLGLERGLRLGRLEGDLLPAREAVALGPRLAVDERARLREQPLGRRTRAHLGQRGEEAVQPLSRGLGRDPDCGQVRRHRLRCRVRTDELCSCVGLK